MIDITPTLCLISVRFPNKVWHNYLIEVYKESHIFVSILKLCNMYWKGWEVGINKRGKVMAPPRMKNCFLSQTLSTYLYWDVLQHSDFRLPCIWLLYLEGWARGNVPGPKTTLRNKKLWADRDLVIFRLPMSHGNTWHLGGRIYKSCRLLYRFFSTLWLLWEHLSFQFTLGFPHWQLVWLYFGTFILLKHNQWVWDAFPGTSTQYLGLLCVVRMLCVYCMLEQQ